MDNIVKYLNIPKYSNLWVISFLNTLSQFEDGYGYWVKVNEDDTLVINGNPISHDFIPPFNAGWNLMGYLEGYSQSVSSYFDFLLDEESFFCVLPEEFKDHHLTILEENENMEKVTEEDIKNAKKVLEKAKEQKKEIDFESYKI